MDQNNKNKCQNETFKTNNLIYSPKMSENHD